MFPYSHLLDLLIIHILHEKIMKTLLFANICILYTLLYINLHRHHPPIFTLFVKAYSKFIIRIVVYKKTPNLSTECPFLSYSKAFTSCMVYYFFASSIVTRSISILICAFISSFSASFLAFSASLRAFSAFRAVISSCITYTEEIGPPL